MKVLEERIIREGKTAPGDVLMVGSFLNQQIDVSLGLEMGREFYRLFRDDGVTKIFTIESSGIALACFAATFFRAPVIFAKKAKTSNVSGEVYTASAHSYTHNCDNTIVISKEYILPTDRILIVDDFLAAGSSLSALISIVKDAGATLVGAGIAIEKEYQGGGNKIRKTGVRVESLAKIAEMSVENGIRFCEK